MEYCRERPHLPHFVFIFIFILIVMSFNLLPRRATVLL
jgi:uncharacterized membrane protein YadS